MGQLDIRSVIPGPGLHLARINGQLYVKHDGAFSGLGRDVSLDELLRLPLAELRESLLRARPNESIVDGLIEAPIQSQEVWAAGVTYQRSREARAEESVNADPHGSWLIAVKLTKPDEVGGLLDASQYTDLVK